MKSLGRILLLSLVAAGCSRGQSVDVANLGDGPADVRMTFAGRTITGDIGAGATRRFSLWEGAAPNSLDVSAKWAGHVTHSTVFRSAYPKGSSWRMNVSPSGVVMGDGNTMPGVVTLAGVGIAAVLLSWAWRAFRNKPKADS